MVVNHASSVQSYVNPNAPVVGNALTSDGTVGVTALFLNLILSTWNWPCSFDLKLPIVPLLPGNWPTYNVLAPKLVPAVVLCITCIPLM